MVGPRLPEPGDAGATEILLLFISVRSVWSLPVDWFSELEQEQREAMGLFISVCCSSVGSRGVEPDALARGGARSNREQDHDDGALSGIEFLQTGHFIVRPLLFFRFSAARLAEPTAAW